MSKSNFLEIDGHILRTFLVILESSSVTMAADKLELTQSAVSQTLAKLRKIIGDPLFVRSGQGLTPTHTALSLKEPVQKVLDDLNGLTQHRVFDPALEEMHFVIAANDMQRDLIFPQLLRELHEERISIEFEFVPSGHPTISTMREARCHMALTPVPPDGSDIIQKQLFSGKMMCYYDSKMREPPKTWDVYRNAEHLGVHFVGGGSSLAVLKPVDTSKIRKPMVSVSNFNAIPAFIAGTNLIATELSLMHIYTLNHLDIAPLPFESETVSIYMIWHERSTNDPAHIWLRNRIEIIANQVRLKAQKLLE